MFLPFESFGEEGNRPIIYDLAENVKAYFWRKLAMSVKNIASRLLNSATS